MSILVNYIGFKQQTGQERDAPGLQPSDFFDHCNCINQTPVPQQVNRQRKQKAQQYKKPNTSTYQNKFIHFKHSG